MKKDKIKIILAIVFFILFVAFVSIRVAIDIEANENNTIEFKGTIDKVQLVDDAAPHYEICVTEYDGPLVIIEVISKNLDRQKITKLSSGDVIFFRIKENAIEAVDKGPFIPIVSLRTTNEKIFTLENYVKWCAVPFEQKAFCTFVALGSLMISVINLILFFRSKRVKE